MYKKALTSLIFLIFNLLCTFMQAKDDNLVGHIEPGVCSLGFQLTVSNNGFEQGWYDLALKTEKQQNNGEFIAMYNVSNPKQRFYFGFGPDTRKSQVFRGTKKVGCLLCKGLIGRALDPNDIHSKYTMCKSPDDDLSTCMYCKPEPVDCSAYFDLTRCYAGGYQGAQRNEGMPVDPSPGPSPIGALGLTDGPDMAEPEQARLDQDTEEEDIEGEE